MSVKYRPVIHMGYLTVAFFKFGHRLKTFCPSSEVLLNVWHSNRPCSLWYVLECCCYCNFICCSIFCYCVISGWNCDASTFYSYVAVFYGYICVYILQCVKSSHPYQNLIDHDLELEQREGQINMCNAL